MRLPHHVQTDESDAQDALSFIGADHELAINIGAATDAAADEYEKAAGSPITDFGKGNVKARMRMIAQFELAGEKKALVVGTDHAAEAVTGFFTKFGDGAADVVPLAGLNKGRDGNCCATSVLPNISSSRFRPRTCSMTNPARRTNRRWV